MSRALTWICALALTACEARPAASPALISDPFARIFARLDVDGSGAIEQAELLCHDPASLLLRLDQDSDGSVSPAELRADLNRWPERGGGAAPDEDGEAGHRKPPPRRDEAPPR